MLVRKRLALVGVVALLTGACAGTTATPTPAPTPAPTATPAAATPAPTPAPTSSPAPATPSPTAMVTPSPTPVPATPSPTPVPSPTAAATVCSTVDTTGTDLLANICKAGTIVVGTDPNYAPQSFQNPDGSWQGFDVDTANLIAQKLGVTVTFFAPDFTIVVAGSWADRFDISVGSVTITAVRSTALNFSTPYYYTPAQMSATTASGITTLDGLAGKTICVGKQTTYQDWLNGTLTLVGSPPPATPPANVTVQALKTDNSCPQAVARNDFQGWLTSSTTLAGALAAGAPFVAIGAPVFYEALAVATDKAGSKDPTTLMTAIDTILTDAHADGTLTASSQQWFGGLDLTTVVTP